MKKYKRIILKLSGEALADKSGKMILEAHRLDNIAEAIKIMVGKGVQVGVVIGALLDGYTCPWTFSRAFDTVLDTDDAWAAVLRLPWLDGVRTAGSARSLEHGLDDLLRRAKADERVAQRVVADGGLHADHVPWLARAGVRQFHLDDQVRPGGSRKAYVDEALVRSWRTLIDTEVQHARAAGR